MGDIADVYQQVRTDISQLVTGLSAADLDRTVPATPEWTIRDVVTHLAADASCVIVGDFPREFFAAFGEPDAIRSLNEWTAGQISERAGRSFEEILDEWEGSAKTLVSIMRGETPLPEEAGMFADRALITDAAVHQQDIHGALGIDDGRDAAPVRIGLSGYIATMGWRLDDAGIPALVFDAGDKLRTAGSKDPGATARAARFEFFRALSGRRNPDQIRAWEWEGDPEPYVHYFYPYGLREDALVE